MRTCTRVLLVCGLSRPQRLILEGFREILENRCVSVSCHCGSRRVTYSGIMRKRKPRRCCGVPAPHQYGEERYLPAVASEGREREFVERKLDGMYRYW